MSHFALRDLSNAALTVVVDNLFLYFEAVFSLLWEAYFPMTWAWEVEPALIPNVTNLDKYTISPRTDECIKSKSYNS